jgi:response regulator NasT
MGTTRMRFPSDRPLRIVVAEAKASLQEALARLGHQVVAAQTGCQLVEMCKAAVPDLVVSDVRLPELDGIDAALEVNGDKPVPFILVADCHDPEALSRAAASEGVMAYLIKPVKEADLVAAILVAMSRSEQLQAARREVAELHGALEERKLMERAKGILMRRLQLDEQDAFRRLKKRSSDSNRKMAEVAREVIEAEEVFVRLDRLGGC